MMNEPKPVASLSGTLLARKGGARPAMRPQVQRLGSEDLAHPRHLEDLGWNDMGDADKTPRTADVLPLTPVPVSPESKAEAQAEDEAAAAQLALNAHEIASDTPPEPPIVVQQQALIAETFAQDAAVLVPGTAVRASPAPEKPKGVSKPVAKRKSRRSALAEGRRAAFTLRLDADRHLKLRLASAIGGNSAQQLVTKALDLLLETMPELETLAAQVRPRDETPGK